jgi:hypothetical protein
MKVALSRSEPLACRCISRAGRSGVEVAGVSDRENSKGAQIAAPSVVPYESYKGAAGPNSVDSHSLLAPRRMPRSAKP